MESLFHRGNVWDNVLIVTGALLAALLIHFIIFKLLRGTRLLSAEKMKTVCKQLYSPSRVLLLLLSLLIVWPSVNAITSYSYTLKHILTIILISTVAWLLIKAVRAGRLVLMKRFDIGSRDNLRARKAYTQLHMIENILIFLIILITFGIVLMTFSAVRQVGLSIITSAGIAGIILGFAAQKLIATVLAGIQLAFTQPIRIDDVVIVEGEWGWIEEINLTYVVVRIWDQRRLVLPTTYFIETPFQNWTRTTSQILGTVYLYTDYNVPFEALRKELDRLLQDNELWDGRVKVMQVTDTKESTIEIRILVSAVDSSVAWDLRVYLREKFIEFLRNQFPESLPRTRVELKSEENPSESAQTS